MLETLAIGVFLPATIAGGGWWLSSRLGPLWTQWSLAGVSVAIAYFVGHCQIAGLPSLRANGDIVHILPWLPMVGVVLSFVSAKGLYHTGSSPSGHTGSSPSGVSRCAAVTRQSSECWSIVLFAAAGFLLAWLILRPLLTQGSALEQPLTHIVGLGCAGWGAWFVLRTAMSNREEALSDGFLLLVVVVITIPLLILSGTAKTALLAATLAAALAAIWVVMWRVPLTRPLFPFLVPILSFLLVGLWGIAVYYAEMPRISLIFVLVALSTLLLGHLRAFAQLGPWSRVIIRTLILLAVLSGALGSAARRYFSEAPDGVSGATTDTAADGYGY